MMEEKWEASHFSCMIQLENIEVKFHDQVLRDVPEYMQWVPTEETMLAVTTFASVMDGF